MLIFSYTLLYNTHSQRKRLVHVPNVRNKIKKISNPFSYQMKFLFQLYTQNYKVILINSIVTHYTNINKHDKRGNMKLYGPDQNTHKKLFCVSYIT